MVNHNKYDPCYMMLPTSQMFSRSLVLGLRVIPAIWDSPEPATAIFRYDDVTAQVVVVPSGGNRCQSPAEWGQGREGQT